jgi:O-antigen ligase
MIALVGRALRGRADGRSLQTLLVFLPAALAVELGLLLAHVSVKMAIAVVLLPVVAWVLSRSYGGLALGTALILALPSWQTLGSAQLTSLRLASAAAAVTLLVTRRFRPHAIDLALIFFVLVLIGDWVLQYNHPHAGRVLSIELTPLGFYLGARALRWRHARPVLLVMILAGTAGALTVLYEYAHGSAVFLSPLTYQWNPTAETIFRPGGVFGSPPGAATVLCLVVLMGLPYLGMAKGHRRIVAGLCLVVCGVALTLTFTRAGLIAGALGILLFLWLTRSRLLRPLPLAWAATGVAILLIVLLPALHKNTTLQEGIFRSGTLAAREGYWSIALPVFTSSPHNFLFGVGTAALEAPSLSGSDPIAAQLAIRPQLTSNSLHSQYVTILVEQGLLGAVALAALLFLSVVPLVRRARATSDPICAACAAAIVATAIIFSVDTALLHGPSFAMFMLALGLGANRLTSPEALSAPTAPPRLQAGT